MRVKRTDLVVGEEGLAKVLLLDEVVALLLQLLRRGDLVLVCLRLNKSNKLNH